MLMRMLLTLFCGCVLAACQSAPPVQFYVLESTAPKPTDVKGPSKAFTIGIGPVSVPALLDRKKIVTHLAGNGVQIAEFQQWATPLQDNLTETLARNLSQLQPRQIIRNYPWSVYGNVDVQVIIDFARFDTTPGKSTNLEAKWTIKSEKNQAILQNGHTELSYALPDSTYPGTVRGLSNILSAFSQELASAITKVLITEKNETESK